MSGSTRAITLSLSVRDADKLQSDLRALGTAGEEALRRLEAAVAKPVPGLRQVQTAANDAGTSFGGMTQKVQNAGYQLQDFFVQVQMGTSAVTALTQQGSQFLGAFGPAGAIAGAGLAIGAVAYQFLTAGDNAEAAAKRAEAEFKGVADGQRALGKAIEDVNVLYRTQAEQAKAAAAAGRDALGSVLNLNLNQLVQRNEGNAMDAVAAQRELAEAEARIARRDAEIRARTGSRVNEFQRDDASTLFGLRARVAGIQADMSRVSERIGQVNEARARLEAAPAERPEDPPRPPRAPGAPRTAAERPDPNVTESYNILRRSLLDVDEAADRSFDAFARLRDQIDPSAAAARTLSDAVAVLNDALDKGAVSQDEYTQRMSQASDVWSKYLATASGQARSTGNTFDSVFGKIESGFENAIASGRSFGDVIKSLEQDLAKLIIRQAITKPLGDALGSAVSSAGQDLWGAYSMYTGGSNAAPSLQGMTTTQAMNSLPATPSRSWFAEGGIMTSLGPLPLNKYATGGIASSPQVAVYGEGRSPEAYVPLPDGRSIPVTMRGQAPAAAAPVTISIDARGAEQGVEQRINAVLARRMPAILAAARTDIASRVNAGGSMAQTMGRR